jgi:hypothetical protein
MSEPGFMVLMGLGGIRREWKVRVGWLWGDSYYTFPYITYTSSML